MSGIPDTSESRLMERVQFRDKTKPKSVSILDTTSDPHLFASHFKKRKLWEAWFAFLAALFGLPLTEEQAEIYRKHTGRQNPPSTPSSTAWLVIGRRGGKSFVLALVSVYLSCFRDWNP
jgi:hypothetical protein